MNTTFAFVAFSTVLLALSARGAISVRCDHPGGNVTVLGVDEAAGVVRVEPDLRDTQGSWFHFDFTVSGAAGRKLHFAFPEGDFQYLSSLGPAISRDGGRTWRWLNADGRRHEPANAFDYAFAADENETRFAMSIPYSQKDWDAFVAPYRARKDVTFGALCKSRGGTRDVEFARLPCHGRAEWLFVLTARHHACETTGNPPMEGAFALALGDSPEAAWLRAHADCWFVPFVDKDGVEEGDQGKNRKPYDHNRDYAKGRYPSVRAIKELVVRESAGKRIVFLDLHSPWVRSSPSSPEQDQAFTFGADDPALNAHWNAFREHWKKSQRGGKLVYDGRYDIQARQGYWNLMKKQWDAGYLSSDAWVRTLTNAWLATCCEFGYSLCGGVNSVPAMRELGGNMFKAAIRTASDAEGARVVSFKDAHKIKSWDAWGDHVQKAAVTNMLQKEQPCVTWRRLNALDFGLKEIGRLATRTSDQIKGSKWSVGCETMDRDYAEWDSYKALLPMLGVKHARFFSGWAKTEQEKGVYDFSWLDPQIRECAAMQIKPWVCISYGNPVWGSDFRLGMRVKQVTGNPEAFAAWIRYVKALVARYRDVVDEWEVWNEPFGQAAEYAELFLRTARAVREVQPEAKIYCTAISMAKDMSKSDYAVVLDKLKRENALDLASYFVYHPYSPNPDDSYEAGDGQFGWQMAMPLREFVKSYSPDFDVMQGEVGCPAQLEFAHALNGIEWTEHSQAKWDLRRAIGDAARDVPSSVFTMIDLQYTFMLQSFGLVRSNALKEFVYRRPKWYAMRNVYALFDDDTKPAGLATRLPAAIERRADPRDAAPRTLTRADFKRFGRSLHLFWYSDERPSNRLEFDRATLRVPDRLDAPVWVEMITGRVGEIDAKNVRIEGNETVLSDVPTWDSPVLIADLAAVPLAK
ncbi:MAG: hypothetical protein MJ138_00080 [Kiritimatiellae bacterium]|nr:hypothetical protein [Kiritimatiellia bacterium]